MHLRNLFLTIHSALLKITLPEHLDLEGQMEVAISEMSYPSTYKNVTDGKIVFSGTNYSNFLESFKMEPGLYQSLADFVEALNTLIQKRHNLRVNCMAVKVTRRTQKIEISLAKERPGFAFFSADLGHPFGAMLAMTLEYCSDGKNLTSHCLLVIL